MRSLQQLALVGAGGVLGAIVRWGIITTPDRALLADAISIPTLAVNVVGCLLLGMLLANPLPEQAHWFLAAGFGASVTTMSTFAVELVDGLNSNVLGTIAYAVLSLGAGFAGYEVAARARMAEPETTEQRIFQAIGLSISVSLGLVIVNGLFGAFNALFDESFFVALAFPVAAFGGAALRGLLTGLDKSLNRQAVAVLAINTFGAFLLGALTGAADINVLTGTSLAVEGADPTSSFSAAVILVWGTAALGSFTTFSTLISQASQLVADAQRKLAGQLIAATVVLSVVAAAIGRLIT